MSLRHLFLLLSFSLSGLTHSQQNLVQYKYYLETFYNVKNIPSVSAGITHNGKNVFTGYHGYIDIENNIRADSNSVYRIASVSKTITALAIIQLVEKKQVNPDEDVRTYLKTFPAKKWKFTIRQLLTHTSGMRTYLSTDEFDSKEQFSNISEAVDYLAKDTLVAEPGTAYIYSSLAYNLLGAVIEKVSGLSFNDYIKKYIFIPAGMNSTRLDFQREIIPHRARGYVKNSYRKFENAALVDLSIKLPGGGILCTLPDLLRLGNAILSGVLFDKKWLDTMAVPLRLKNGDIKTYGLGVGIWSDELENKFFGHSGAGTGFASQLLLHRDSGIVTAYLINLRDRNLGNPAQVFASIYLNVPFQIPKPALSDSLMELYLAFGLDTSITFALRNKESDSIFVSGTPELILFGDDLKSIGRNADSKKVFQTILGYDQNSYEANFKLGDIYALENNTGLALRFYKNAYLISPKKDLEKKIKNLESKK